MDTRSKPDGDDSYPEQASWSAAHRRITCSRSACGRDACRGRPSLSGELRPRTKTRGSREPGALGPKVGKDVGVPTPPAPQRVGESPPLATQPHHSPPAALTSPPRLPASLRRSRPAPFPGWRRGEAPRPQLLPVAPRWRTQ